MSVEEIEFVMVGYDSLECAQRFVYILLANFFLICTFQALIFYPIYHLSIIILSHYKSSYMIELG